VLQCEAPLSSLFEVCNNYVCAFLVIQSKFHLSKHVVVHFAVKVQNMVKKWVSRWHDGRNMSLRTQTSTVIVSEQMSLHSTVRDETQSTKARGGGVLTKADNVEFPRMGDAELVDRGYVNGFDSEQFKKSLLKENDQQELTGWDGKKEHVRFRQYSSDAENEFDYRIGQHGKLEEDDDEQDIIKEDLV